MRPGAVEIIAEIANAHQGEPAAAVRLAEAAIEAGADAVKFQVYAAEELLVRAHPRYDHFRAQAFDAATWADILGRVAGRGAAVYCDVFGLDALDIAEAARVDGIKVHSSDLSNVPLLRRLARTDTRIFLAVGGSTAAEITGALDLLGDVRPVLLHGFQSYPTAVEDAALARLTWLRQAFGERAEVGYMDHVDGDDPFAFTLPAMAVALGATVIEKHVILDRAAKGVDYYSSLDPDEFARFVSDMRRAAAALGDPEPAFTAAERRYRKDVKKHWVTTRALPVGHVLTEADLVMKRVHGHDAEPVELDKLLGRALGAACAEEAPLTRAHVPAAVWALVVARLKSSRLPKKALVDVGGMPALAHLFARLKQARRLDRIVLCTTTEDEDDALARLAGEHGVAVHRGPVEDVLGRMLGAIEGQAVDVVLRVTGDDILVDPDYLDRAVAHHLSTNAQYSDLKALPSGTEVEVFDAELLRGLWRAARDRDGTEYLTTYVTVHRDQFRVATVPVDPPHARDWRLTLDTPEDYDVIVALLQAMDARGKALDYRLDDIVAFLDAHPEVLAQNAGVRQRGTPPEVCVELDWARIA